MQSPTSVFLILSPTSPSSDVSPPGATAWSACFGANFLPTASAIEAFAYSAIPAAVGAVVVFLVMSSLRDEGWVVCVMEGMSDSMNLGTRAGAPTVSGVLESISIAQVHRSTELGDLLVDLSRTFNKVSKIQRTRVYGISLDPVKIPSLGSY